MSGPGELTRRLGLRDAVVIGVGSMVGAGVFAAFGPAARAAGGWLLLGLVIGTYSSVFTATPLLTYFQEKWPLAKAVKEKRKPRNELEDSGAVV